MPSVEPEAQSPVGHIRLEQVALQASGVDLQPGRVVGLIRIARGEEILIQRGALCGRRGEHEPGQPMRSYAMHEIPCVAASF